MSIPPLNSSSNNKNGFVVTSSPSVPNYENYYPFNNGFKTITVTTSATDPTPLIIANEWRCQTNNSGDFLQISGPIEMEISSFIIAGSENGVFQKWNVKGSEDGMNWMTICTRNEPMPTILTKYNLISQSFSIIRITCIEDGTGSAGIGFFQCYASAMSG